MSNVSNPAKNYTTWSAVRDELFSPEQIASINCRSSITSEILDARDNRGIDRQKLIKMSGLNRERVAQVADERWKQPGIDDVLAVLGALGKTLKVVPIEEGLKR